MKHSYVGTRIQRVGETTSSDHRPIMLSNCCRLKKRLIKMRDLTLILFLSSCATLRIWIGHGLIDPVGFKALNSNFGEDGCCEGIINLSIYKREKAESKRKQAQLITYPFRYLVPLCVGSSSFFKVYLI